MVANAVVQTRVARDRAPQFDPLVPNAETVLAMKESRQGGLSFDSIDALITDLHPDE